MLKKVLIVVLGIIAMVIAGGVIYWWPLLSKEHREARNLPIRAVNIRNLNDGTYIGEYEGGMYKWRANEVQVTVSSGKVIDIKLLMSKANRPPEFTNELYGRVIKSQSLQVDTISGATLTSKAYLKSVENALDKAEKK